MGRDDAQAPKIGREAIERLLHRRFGPSAQLLALSPLGGEEQRAHKSYGYGRPLLIRALIGATERKLVLHTMSPDPFGHDRRSDRLAALADAADNFGTEPRHVHPLELGVLDTQGQLHELPGGEPYLLTEHAEGRLYAEDLRELARSASATERDHARARALANHLAQLHREPAPATSHSRCLRDTVGGGEGIFGLAESYPPSDRVATPARLMQLELGAVRWRWQLKPRAHRARRTHGDFHPFNILFREGDDFSVLDRSRGGAGDPADDVVCLSVNYLFFALRRGGAFDGALRQLWHTFWNSYLDATHDEELFVVAAPFLVWRLLVLASPTWYPEHDEHTRDRLLRIAEYALHAERLSPDEVDRWLA